MNLLYEIRGDLVSETAPLPNTLRKARVLAHELGSQELRDWVSNELHGYPVGAMVPSYRRFSPPLFGTFHGPFQTQITQVTITTYGLPEIVRNAVHTLILTDGVAVLTEMLASREEVFHKTLPVEYTQLLQQYNRMTGGMFLFETYQQLPCYFVAGILDNVKNGLLEFVIDLQEKKVTSTNVNSDNGAQEAVRNSFNFHIYGDHNIVATGENVNQEFSIVHKGDVDSLIEYLRARSVSDEDLDELKDALVAEPNATPSGFGSKVNAWLGKMTTKALRGVWQARVANAPAMLEQALQKFYGG